MSISNHSLNLQPCPPEPVRTHQNTACESFFDIWFADGPIYGAIHGPRLADINKPDWVSDRPNWKRSRKKVEEDWGDINYFIGKRFNSRTSYLMIDIDSSSPYHPSNDRAQYDRLLEVLEEIGLVRSVVLRSSHSGGLHLYFPLGKKVKTWTTAKKLHDYLITQGFRIKGGTLELFPNPKADRNAQYNGHRLPLQLGSYLLDENLEIWSGDRQDFLNTWNTSSVGNALDFAPAPVERRDISRKTHYNPPPISWTGPRQSNDVLRELANWGYEKENLKTVPKLGDWMKKIAPQLPGFQQFASKESQRDIQADWCFRWARSRVRRGDSKLQSHSNRNQERAEQATQRLRSVLSDCVGKVWRSANQLFLKVCDILQRRFGVGISKRTFQARKVLWEGLLNESGRPDLNSREIEEPDKEEADEPSSRVDHTVDYQKMSVQADYARDSIVPTDEKCGDCAPQVPLKCIAKAQLKNLPNPQKIMATGAELKQAGIDGYDLRHTWTIHRGEYSAELWNRLRFVAFGGTSC